MPEQPEVLETHDCPDRRGGEGAPRLIRTTAGWYHPDGWALALWTNTQAAPGAEIVPVPVAFCPWCGKRLEVPA